MFSAILIPIDLAHVDQMDKALALAATVAKQEGATVHLLGATSSQPTSVAHNVQEYEQKLASFAKSKSDQYGVTMQPHATALHDLPVELNKRILSTARELDCDLIVMQSHIPGPIDHVFASHGGTVAAQAKCSVFVVR